MSSATDNTMQSSLTLMTEQFTNICNELSTINSQTRTLQSSLRNLHKNYRKQRQQVTRKQKKTNTKIHKPMNVNAKLAKFLKLSEPVISKKDAMGQISAYIKTKNLQVETEKRKFVPNKPLMTLFGLKGKKPQLTFVEINKYISPYFVQ